MNSLLRTALLATVALVAVGSAGLPVLADQRTDEINAIIRALDVDEAVGRTIVVKSPQTITIRIGARTRTIVIDADRSVDVTVFFKYNSAELTAQGKAELDKLGAALASDALRPQRFLIAGHTDAKGTRAYNRMLSLRRARAVRDYLVANWNIAPERLEVYGWGEDRLKDPVHPQAAINRRVEVTLILPPEVVGRLGKTKIKVNDQTVVETPSNVKVDVTVKPPSSPPTPPTRETAASTNGATKDCPDAVLNDPRPATQPIDDFGGQRTPVPCGPDNNLPNRIKLND